jgi:hypothetical protein
LVLTETRSGFRPLTGAELHYHCRLRRRSEITFGELTPSKRSLNKGP